MTRALFIRLYFALGAAVLLAACGTGDYQKPVQTFAEATATAQKSLDGYVDALTAKVAEIRTKEAIANPGKVQIKSADDCIAESTEKHCRIIFLNSKGQEKELPPADPIPKIRGLVGEIKAYADSLEAIATSDSASKAEASLASANGSLQNLAKLIEQKGTNLEAFAEPAASAAGWIVGAYTDHVRLEALRTATRNADGLIDASVKVFEKAAITAEVAVNTGLSETVSTGIEEFGKSPSDSNLRNLIEAAQAMDSVLTAAPDKVFRNLAAAHHELTKALNSKEMNLQSAFEQMNALKSEADKLEKIVSAFVAATKAK
jgi:hypothetical protein